MHRLGASHGGAVRCGSTASLASSAAAAALSATRRRCSAASTLGRQRRHHPPLRAAAASRPDAPPPRLADAAAAVESLRALALRASSDEFADDIAAAHPSLRASATNLAHYLAVRRVDQRALQMQLQALGVSSLGNMEMNVLPHLDAVLRALRTMAGTEPPLPEGAAAAAAARAAKLPALLQHHATAVLGAAPRLGTRVMVTLPAAAATDASLVDGYLRSGMSLARINCAHDSPAAWRRMAAHVRAAEARQGRRALLTFDLAGPKMRVGAIEPGPAVARAKPARDALGRAVAAACVVLYPSSSPPPDVSDVAAAARGGACAAVEGSTGVTLLPLDGAEELLARARVGDALHVRADARGRRRVFRIALARPWRYVVACCDATTYFIPGTRLDLRPRRRRRSVASAAVGAALPRERGALRLSVGDTLRVRRGGGVARAVPGGATLFLQVPRLFACVAPGQRLLLDDGRLAGVVVADVAQGAEGAEGAAEGAACDAFTVRLTHAAAPPGRGARLREAAGVNAPDSQLDAPAMDDDDRAALAHVLPLRPDAISLSFVQRPEDVRAAHAALRRHPHAALILKIETAAAFARLPELLFAGMQRPGLALMLARGDLGPEVGWARLSEVQEEVMMLAEASHTPLVYATQVLESMVRTGVPSRAEVTDAGAGARAEATMLNKGPFVERAMALLQDICTRLAGHQHKRMHLLRRLRCAADAAAAGEQPCGGGAAAADSRSDEAS
jgi:pyruvate kinase